MLECIVYSSTAIAPMAPAELEGLMTEARARNAESGITGLLLYEAPRFMQLIEGEGDDIARLFGRIRSDPRHGSLRLLHRGPQARRLFPNWSMALRDVAAMPESERAYFSSFLDDLRGGRPDPEASSASPAMGLLEAFADALRKRARIEAAMACLAG